MVPFHQATQGNKYFFPVTGQEGTVANISGRGRRRVVTVRFSGDHLQNYVQRSWVACLPEHRNKFSAGERNGPQIVGLQQVNAKIERKPRPPKQVAVAPRRKHQSLRPPKIDKMVTDDRPAPVIPGPPVPKPIAGVWSELTWT